MSEWSIVEGSVDRTKEHVEVRYRTSEAGVFEPAACAWFARAGDAEVVVEHAPGSDAERRDAVLRKLEYYFVERGEPDPWQYAVYHCTTAANVYSGVRWVHRAARG